MLDRTLPQMLTRLLVDHSEDERMLLLMTLTTDTKTTVINMTTIVAMEIIKTTIIAMTTNATMEMIKTPIIAMATNAPMEKIKAIIITMTTNITLETIKKTITTKAANVTMETIIGSHSHFSSSFLVYILSFEIFITYNSFLFGYI